VDKKPDRQPAAEEQSRQVENQKPFERTKRPTQRSIEASLMRTAVIAGLVFIALGAAVALWIFVSYRP
jgi:hypothetical protein